MIESWEILKSWELESRKNQYILLTGSNNQFRNYESEFTRIFWPIKTNFTSLIVIFHHKQ